MKRSELTPSENYEATYCPEDDKLRLYVGRVSREEYEFLRAEGWTSTPKQSCDFVAVWTPSREATAIQYAGDVGDEDTPPTERAADRAERFEGYREKRTGEATEYADSYEGAPVAGFQSQARADRADREITRMADKASDQWSKAEYWQRRTAGVIEHALHKQSPSVRMGRIKTIEADLRKAEKDHADWVKRWDRVSQIVADPQPLAAHLMERFGKTAAEAEKDVAEKVLGSCAKVAHPRNGDPEKKYIFELIRDPDPVTLADFCDIWKRRYPTRPQEDNAWIRHMRLRIAYETQMLEAQGGRAAMVEMEVGGWLRVTNCTAWLKPTTNLEDSKEYQIQKVNKSNATGRVVSVEIRHMSGQLNPYGNPWRDGKGARMISSQIKVERAPIEVYRAPTAEEKAAFEADRKQAKKDAPKKETIPLINPTKEDAERLQAMLNEAHLAEFNKRHGTMARFYTPKEPGKVQYVTQAVYSANSKGAYARAETRGLCKAAQFEDAARAKARGPALCKLRVAGYQTLSIVHITDKPAKPLPAAVWEVPAAEQTEQLELIAA